MGIAKDSGASGYLLVSKPPGITSFQTLGGIKKAFTPSKVGHTGTLDKFASGLLLVLVGRAVKLAPWFSGSDKEYRGTVFLGAETDTLDPEGAEVAWGPVPSREALDAALDQFRGPIWQAPPVYSAVHREGTRAYLLARAGKQVVMEKRRVTIYSLDLEAYDPPLARIAVRCSKGVYIRSLARDIALAAGSRGYLSALTRTGIAGFSLAEATEMAAGEGDPFAAALRPLDADTFARLGIPCFTADAGAVEAMVRGKSLGALFAGGHIALPPGLETGGEISAGVFRESGELAALIRGRPAGSGIDDAVGAGKMLWTYGYVYARG
jgi:tRNA pseudouridine55 synthase